MEPIMIIVTALALGAAAGLKEKTEQLIKDSYTTLKTLITSKFPQVGSSLDQLEHMPDSKARRAVVEEDLIREGAGHDAEILVQAKALLEVIVQRAPTTGEVIGVRLSNIEGGTIRINQEVSPVSGDRITVGSIAGIEGVAIGRGAHATVYEAAPSAVVKVFYATDRKRTYSKKASRYFGPGRGELSYGVCEVSIPRDHRMGQLESPSILRLEFREDLRKHVVLLSVMPKDRDQYFAELATRIRASSGKNAFIFIHGYNVSFADAARRTAQISYDLGFNGGAVFYSWPSQATFKRYPVDETNVEWTEAKLKKFLDDFIAHSGAENIYIIAHSMGNRALTRVFSTLISEKPLLRHRFREIILAAPDIDAEVFKNDIAPKIIGSSPLVTLYASSEDIALLASKKFHGYPRAGDAGTGLILMEGIDTIDATGVDTSFLKHSYYAEARSILADIFYLIHESKRPDQRFALEPVNIAGRRYWKFKQ